MAQSRVVVLGLFERIHAVALLGARAAGVEGAHASVVAAGHRLLANPALLLTNAGDFGSGRCATAFYLSVRSRTPFR
jgi:hypothetical protein